MIEKHIEDAEAGKWISLPEVEVLQLWDAADKSIRQVGILKDGTGIIKFVSWEKSNLPYIEEGGIYSLENLPVTLYNDRLSVAMVSTTLIKRLGTVQSQIPGGIHDGDDQNFSRAGSQQQTNEIPTI